MLLDLKYTYLYIPRLFFRRHYPVKSISHCGLDMDDRKWTQTNEDGVPINTW